MKDFVVTMVVTDEREFIVQANSKKEANDLLNHIYRRSNILERVQPDEADIHFHVRELADEDDEAGADKAVEAPFLYGGSGCGKTREITQMFRDLGIQLGV